MSSHDRMYPPSVGAGHCACPGRELARVGHLNAGNRSGLPPTGPIHPAFAIAEWSDTPNDKGRHSGLPLHAFIIANRLAFVQ